MKKLFVCFFALAVVHITNAQEPTKEDIQKRQQQLLQEISSLNNTLNDIKKNKKTSLAQLTMVQRKIAARQELINNINRDLRRLDDNIYNNQLQIYRLKKELDTLKGQYAKSLVFAYKNRSNYDYLNFLFSATSFNDALKRVAYLKSYRQYRETQVNNIVKTQQLLSNQIGLLNSNKSEKNNSLKEQSKQLTVLEDDKKEKDQVVNNLKSQEKDIAAQIREKQQMQQKLQNALQTIIKREIAAANKKKEEEEKKKKLAAQQNNNTTADNNNSGTKSSIDKNAPVPGAVNTSTSTRQYNVLESTTEEANVSINFENSKGRLPWPADQGYVSIHFGPYTIPGTKLKGDMSGIEITLPVGSSVKSVADGVVSTVFDLGGNGQVVVIRHGKYFTTYSNLSGVTVGKGTEVHAGKILGKAVAGSSGDGQIIFMVNNDKGTFLNPESWLKSR